MSTTINLFDLIFIFSTLVFVAIGFFRGFIKDFFSLINWIVAFALSYICTPFVIKFVSHYIGNTNLVSLGSAALLFILFFLITYYSTKQLISSLDEKIPANFNRFLGIVYGLLKTLLIFGLFYSISKNFYIIFDKSKNHLPTYVTESKFLFLIKPSGEMLDPLTKMVINDLPHEIFGHKKGDKKEELDKKIDEILEEDKSKEKKKDEAKDETKKAKEAGYSKKEIEKMNRLIEIVQ